MSCGICYFLFFFSLVSLACVSPSWVLCPVAQNPRIQRSEFVNSYQQQRVCCFLYAESVSGLDALHIVLNSGFVHTLPKEQASSAQQIFFLRGHDPYTLACKSRPSFDRCRTSLGVSLSLSFHCLDQTASLDGMTMWLFALRGIMSFFNGMYLMQSLVALWSTPKVEMVAFNKGCGATIELHSCIHPAHTRSVGSCGRDFVLDGRAHC